MPAKLSTICYIHNLTQRSVKEFNIKEFTGIVRLSDEDPSKIIYLKVKAFIPLDREIESNIEEFESSQVIYLRGKFIGRDGWYTVRPFKFYFRKKNNIHFKIKIHVKMTR
jgi:hypothetical protein